ncbi:MAG: HAMP domain-containing sensor histidine kinase, partial [Ginsengibacter sp.]
MDQQKDYFISVASHELKTPITSIKGYVQMLSIMYDKSEDTFLKTSLTAVDRQILKLTTLISDLLDISKIKSGSLPLSKEDFEIKSVIKDCIDEIEHINPAYKIIYHSKDNLTLYADRERIGQVFINFLTNAVKYSPGKSEVIIESFKQENNIVVMVKDSGIGISKKDQQKIFERFYRVEGKSEKTFPGFGIGLFIVAEIIQRHNGKIGVESEPGKGSSFYFS